MGFGKFWKIYNAIFQDLENFRKKRFFKLTMEKFWIFVYGSSRISCNGHNLKSY